MSERRPSDGVRIACGEPGYPPRLLDLPDPPPALYVRGSVEVLERPSLSIIGARRATPYGAALSELAARIAVECGIVVVSGGAIGCDGIAGREAIARGGTHVAVLGSGADVAYPRQNADLFEQTIACGGAVISIERWGAPPARYTFPKRNRVIAALSDAVFIGEASMPSGTFSTAETAADLGREVLVAPGSIFSAASRGANYLISVGACCIADEEALEVALARIYGALRRPRDAPITDVGGTERERALLRALIASPLRVDELSRACGMDARDCVSLLSALTVQGLVERQLDGRYAASARALHARTSFGQNG